MTQFHQHMHRADSTFAPSQWETLLQSNAVSHWLGANLESALMHNKAKKIEQTTVKRYRDVGNPELILGLRPANERRRYFVTTSLIGWTQASIESALETSFFLWNQ